MGVNVSKPKSAIKIQVKECDCKKATEESSEVTRLGPPSEKDGAKNSTKTGSKDPSFQESSSTSTAETRTDITGTTSGNTGKLSSETNVRKNKAEVKPVTETNYIKTSQFPYKKPKALPAKLFLKSSTSKGTAGSSCSGKGYPERGFNATSSFKFHPDLQGRRRWADPSESASGMVAPHRTVMELRRAASETKRGYPTDFYNQEQFVHSRETWSGWGPTGVKRPPTPQRWYPARRTEDYLVASCLLAAEQEKDRLVASNRFK